MGQYDRLLSTILIGNNIVNIATASIGTVLFVHHYGDAGATMRSMGDALDNDPLLKDAHLFASHFVEQLESCGALEFTDAWRVTDAFRAANPARA